MTQRQQLSEIIITVTDLRDASPYKKTYDNVLKTLKRKLARAKFEGKIVDNVQVDVPEVISLHQNVEDSTLQVV